MVQSYLSFEMDEKPWKINITLSTGSVFGKHGGISDLWKQEVLWAGQQDERVDTTAV